MSEGQVNWEIVARELVKIVGTEAARGLLYAFMAQGIYPLLQQAIASVSDRMRSGRVSQEEAWREIALKLAELQSKQPLTPPRTESELVAQLARTLQQQAQMMGQLPIYPQPPAPAGLPPAGRAGAGAELRAEALKERIRILERTKSELLAELYRTTDEGKKKEIETKLKDLEAEINRLYQELEAQTYRV